MLCSIALLTIRCHSILESVIGIFAIFQPYASNPAACQRPAHAATGSGVSQIHALLNHPGGDFQASCPKNYAAFFSRCVRVLAEFSGLSQTSSTRFQFLMLRLQRNGCLRFASWYNASRFFNSSSSTWSWRCAGVTCLIPLCRCSLLYHSTSTREQHQVTQIRLPDTLDNICMCETAIPNTDYRYSPVDDWRNWLHPETQALPWACCPSVLHHCPHAKPTAASHRVLLTRLCGPI